MLIKRTMLWVALAMVVGAGVGFGLRGTIASVLNLSAQEAILPPKWGTPVDTHCPPPKIWTGNGCADPRGWTTGDQLFFAQCLRDAMDNPPPPLPDHAITPDEYASCAQQTEKGKGRQAQSMLENNKFVAEPEAVSSVVVS